MMKRLMYKDSSLPRRNERGETIEAYSDHDVRELINRLAAYEDLDTEPEEVVDVLAFCKENGLKNLVGLLNAIATDRVIVLPCKVGDEIWSGAPFADGNLRKGEIVQINVDEDGFCGFWASFGAEPVAAEFVNEDIGKSIFFTREEAEAAAMDEVPM